MRTILAVIALCVVLLPICVMALSPPHDATNSMDCDKCHKVHPSSKAAIGTPAGNENLCRSCHNPVGASDAEVHLHANGANDTCTTCHSVHDQEQIANGSTFGKFVKANVSTPNSGVKAVIFKGKTGPNSFADGDATYNGICEVCHTKTKYHRNNSTGDHSHYAAQDCTECHVHPSGFQPTATPTDCVKCHNSAVGPGGYRRQVVDGSTPIGDFSRKSHHVYTGTAQSVVMSDCRFCHDQSAHKTFTDGVSVKLNDPDMGAAITYNGTPASMETYCKNCHDANAAAGNTHPFTDSKTPTDIVFGTVFAASAHKGANVTCFGDGTTGCHSNGHGSMKRSLLAPDGAAANATNHSEEEEGFCTKCHTTVGTEIAKTRGHNINNTTMSGRHDQYEALASASYSGGKRHVECTDCHSQHWSQSSPSHTIGTNAATGGLKYVSRISTTYGTTANVAPTFTARSARDATPAKEYETCMKCHSSWAFGSTPPATPEGTTETDQSVEFNPNNKSFHPVIGLIPANSYTIPTSTNGNIQTMVSPWDTATHKLMYCSDCHKSNNASAPKGPHGSTNNYVLPTTDLDKGFCLTCHKASVYSPSSSPGTAETGSRFDRQTTGSSSCSHYYHVVSQGYGCRVCHGAVKTLPTSGGKSTEVGSMHGTNTVAGLLNGRNIISYSPGSCHPTCHGTATYTAGSE